MNLIRTFPIIIGLVTFLSSCKNSGHLMSQDTHQYTNELINESSPYLLQHAHNPVNWHAWNDETLAKAQRENKFLIISIGYAACHWCHVMEHESFENEQVAEVMNTQFLPIKVDREERPDIDDIYMTACNLVTGRGGWPLNAIALPDGRPIWAGTYFPKDKWVEILNQFVNLKENDPQKLYDTAERLTSGVNSVGQIDLVHISDDDHADSFHAMIQKMNSQIDQKHGGRKGAPKFPMPNNYELLLKYAHIFNDKKVLNSVLITLDKMAYGGIYDQVGGGFARYSVDGVWKVPHFEKMLYDNGQLIGLYSMAYKLTQKELYKKVVEQSHKFIKREMTSTEGGFYSSLDADSEGVEGKFYVFTEEELKDLLGEELFQIAQKFYSTSPQGNWEHSNILHITSDPTDMGQWLGLTKNELDEKISIINAKLLAARSDRVRPGLDDKILTGWNSLMISGYVEAYKAFGNKEYLDMALKNAEFLKKNQLKDDYRLNRNYKNGQSTINAFLDDYVALSKACMDLYEVTFEEEWIVIAKGLLDYTIAHFKNEENGMFHLTSDLDPPLVAKSTETTDNVIPGTNSTMARNLAKLGELLYVEEYVTMSDQLFSNMLNSVENGSTPAFYSNWAQLWLDKVSSPYEIVVVGKNANEIASNFNKKYLANSHILASSQPETSLPLIENKWVDGKTMIYVCENKSCKLPVEDLDKAFELIDFPKMIE